MPTYTYECPKCNTEIEMIHSITEDPKPKCQKCKTKLDRLIGGGFAAYVRGQSYVSDPGGARRDMNLYKLQKEDPYAQHRVGGEVDHLTSKFKRAGMTKEISGKCKKYKFNKELNDLVPDNEEAIQHEAKSK
jgi:putative FmdB family regulatory protein